MKGYKYIMNELKLDLKEFNDKILPIFPIEGPIINRDVTDFHGKILLLGGTKEEIDGYKKFNPSLGAIENEIYTVNIDAKANPDLVADIGSKSEMQELPSKRFDAVVFSCVPSDWINMKNAFEAAARVIKDNGVLIFTGGVHTDPSLPSLNPTIRAGDDIIDIPGLLGSEGFIQGKPLQGPPIRENGQWVWEKSQGNNMIATKSEKHDLANLLKDLLSKCPVLGTIISRIEPPNKIVDSLPNYEDNNGVSPGQR